MPIPCLIHELVNFRHHLMTRMRRRRRPLRGIPSVSCSTATLIRCYFSRLYLTLNLSLSTRPSAVPSLHFLISTDHSFVFICQDELNARQLQTLLNDNFPHGELIYIMRAFFFKNIRYPNEFVVKLDSKSFVRFTNG